MVVGEAEEANGRLQLQSAAVRAGSSSEGDGAAGSLARLRAGSSPHGSDAEAEPAVPPRLKAASL